MDILETRTTPSIITVTTASDDASHTGVSLRDAVAMANASNNESDTIVFSSTLNGATIMLTQGALELTAGTGATTIQGGNQIRVGVPDSLQSNVFQINQGATATLSALTISGGHADGGGIENLGTLTVSNVWLFGGHAIGGQGGASIIAAP